MALIESDHLLELWFAECSDDGLGAFGAADFLCQQLVGILFFEGVTEEELECLEEVVDIICRSACIEHVVEKFLDVAWRNIFDDGNTMLIMQKAQEIVDLFLVVSDGTRGELTGLTVKNELVPDR